MEERMGENGKKIVMAEVDVIPQETERLHKTTLKSILTPAKVSLKIITDY